jgi:tetrahydromethanopterin S-methyltransferase subunit D
MALKIVAGIIAAALVIAFLAPPILKLQDIALGAVILIGVAMMLVDLWQSLQSKDD